MCIRTILDASLFSRFGNDEMKAWRQWVEKGHGVLAYTTSGRFGQELRNSALINTFVVSQRRAGAQLISSTELAAASSDLRDREFNSNDRHVLELALASRAQVLCTDDRDLKHDFRNLPDDLGGRRAVYPHGANRQARDAFLAARRCRS